MHKTVGLRCNIKMLGLAARVGQPELHKRMEKTGLQRPHLQNSHLAPPLRSLALNPCPESLHSAKLPEAEVLYSKKGNYR